MARAPSSWPDALLAVAAKDILLELRTRYALSSLAMFALVTLSGVSMSLGGAALSPELAAALLWIILFFCAMAGLSRSFVGEQEAGTLFALRLYAPAQAVLFGKMLFNLAMLGGLTVLTVPLYIVLLNVDIPLGTDIILILLLGITGIAAASTLTAAMVAGTQGTGALFAVITFPVLLPQFLAAVSNTAKVLQHSGPGWRDLLFMAGYDAVICIAASILFDYLWND